MRRSVSSLKKSAKEKTPNSCTFTFFGTTWTLIRKRPVGKLKSLGGECNSGTQTITINATYQGDRFKSYLMHELFEGAFLSNGSLYVKNYPGEETIFLLNHDRLDSAAEQIRAAYDEICAKMEG